MTARRWEDLRDGLEHEVMRRGAEAVARELPAHRSTVYRLIRGSTARPSKALRAGIERLVGREILGGGAGLGGRASLGGCDFRKCDTRDS